MIDYVFQFAQISGARAEEFFFQSNLQNHIRQILPGGDRKQSVFSCVITLLRLYTRCFRLDVARFKISLVHFDKGRNIIIGNDGISHGKFVFNTGLLFNKTA